MITEFYKAGDCKNLCPAHIQLDNQEKWKDAQKLKYYESVKQTLIDKIGQLWRFERVDFWEEDWFPGYQDFITDVTAAGYIVKETVRRRNDCGLSQHCFEIRLPDTH